MSPKKRIIHLIQSLGSGGCEHMLLRTLPLLQEFEHTIVTLKELGELAPQFALNGISVHTVHCRSFFDIPGIFRLRKLIKEEGSDVVITYLFHADILGRLALHGTTQSPIIPFLRTTYNHPRYWIARLFERLTQSLTQQYLANSEAVKTFYTEYIGVPKEKITVIPNGIDTEYFDSLVPDPTLRLSLGIGLNDFVIICVANFHPNKGHQYLLEAFEKLHHATSHASLKLLLVGEGTERKKLEQQIQGYISKANILFLGRRTDVPALLKISNLFVLPTLFEGQSNAILEAMAAGLPVVTTDIPENRACITHQKNGWLVSPKSTLALTEAIKAIRSDTSLQNTLGREAKQTIQNHFSLQTSANQFKAFLSAI